MKLSAYIAFGLATVVAGQNATVIPKEAIDAMKTVYKVVRSAVSPLTNQKTLWTQCAGKSPKALEKADDPALALVLPVRTLLCFGRRDIKPQPELRASLKQHMAELRSNGQGSTVFRALTARRFLNNFPSPTPDNVSENIKDFAEAFPEGEAKQVMMDLAGLMAQVPEVMNGSDVVGKYFARVVARMADAMMLGSTFRNPIRDLDGQAQVIARRLAQE